MKKNFTINLAGFLFNIDEDAYELLQHYTDTLRRYYRQQEVGEEVVDDIESRIAELLNEKKQAGSLAITIEHIQEIIQRIGDLEQIASEEGEAEKQDCKENTELNADSNDRQAFKQKCKENVREFISQQTTLRHAINTMRSSKHFYRDMQNKMLFGVIAGLSRFFGGSLLAWRIVTIILSIIMFNIGRPNFWWAMSPVFAYMLLVVLAPKAETPEECLKMKGQAVNPQNLAAEVTEQTQQQNVKREKGSHHVLASIVAVLIFFFSVCCWVGLVVELIIFGCTIATPQFIHGPSFDNPELHQLAMAEMPTLRFLLVLGALTTFIMAYCSLHATLSLFGRGKSMSTNERITWFASWVVLFICTSIIGFRYIDLDKDYWKKYNEIRHYEYSWVDGVERNGVLMGAGESDYFDNNGWEIYEGKHCEHFVSFGQHYNGDANHQYLDAFNGHGNMEYTVWREESVEPGTYRLTAAVRAENEGAYIMASLDDSPITLDDTLQNVRLTAIPSYGNRCGEIWYWGKGFWTAEKAHIPTDMQSNDSLKATIAEQPHGFGWSIAVIDGIEVPHTSLIRYGVTTSPRYTGKESKTKWFSATDFTLEKIK